MHHISHLLSIIHTASSYHQVWVGIVNYLAVYAVPGELSEIDVVAFGMGGNTNIKRVISEKEEFISENLHFSNSIPSGDF